MVVCHLFIIPTEAIRNLKQRNNKIESDFLSFEPFDSMIYDFNNEKVDFISKNISIKATKDYVQDMYDEDLYISNDNLEVLTLRFNNEDDLLEYIDDKYAYMKDDSINIKEENNIKLNITNYYSYTKEYIFEYEDYNYYTYFVILRDNNNNYFLSLVGSKEDIKDYDTEISNMLSSIKIS
jgi:hypothetical protein